MLSGRTRMPLTVWFTSCGLFAPATDGISALSLRRALEIGSYQDATNADFHAGSWRQPICIEHIGNSPPDLRKSESMVVMRGGGSRCADRISRSLSGCDWHAELISGD